MTDTEIRATLAAQEADLDRQVVTSQGYTRGQLRQAFDAVKNPENWKLPIKARVAVDDLAVTREAIIFFTGSVPRIAGSGASGPATVSAVGYYKAVGA